MNPDQIVIADVRQPSRLTVSPADDVNRILRCRILGQQGVSVSSQDDKGKSRLRRFEQLGVEMMPLQEFVELGAIAFCEPGRLCDVAPGYF